MPCTNASGAGTGSRKLNTREDKWSDLGAAVTERLLAFFFFFFFLRIRICLQKNLCTLSELVYKTWEHNHEASPTM